MYFLEVSMQAYVYIPRPEHVETLLEVLVTSSNNQEALFTDVDFFFIFDKLRLPVDVTRNPRQRRKVIRITFIANLTKRTKTEMMKITIYKLPALI